MILKFLNELTESGYRIFSIDDAKEVASSLSIRKSYLPHILTSLIKKGMVRSLMRGHYAVADHILSGAPLHKYEIAMHLAKEGAVCCWSAMSMYELTDQVLTTVFVLVPHSYDKNRSTNHYKIDGYEYVFIQTHTSHFWGTEYKRFGETKIRITDLERTLLDGLIRSNYCGGFREVMSAFVIAKEKLNLIKLVDYASRCSISVRKRLGYTLEKLGIAITSDELGIESTNYYDKLDTAGLRRGKENKKWMILENI